MAQRTILLPDIGEVLLAKRRGAKNLRLSINASGKVRVSMPTWAPYSAGIQFAKSKSDWISDQLSTRQTNILDQGSLIGKAHRLHFGILRGQDGIKTKITKTTVEIRTNWPIYDPRVQDKAQRACERALKQEASVLLPQRLAVLADKLGYSYKEVRVRKLTSRWGSCSNQGVITLSYFLMQLPWRFIDYVLVHELIHTKYLHHGEDFWAAFNKALPGAKQLRKEMKTYSPRVEPA